MQATSPSKIKDHNIDIAFAAERPAEAEVDLRQDLHGAIAILPVQ